MAALFVVVQEATRSLLRYTDTFRNTERGRAVREWRQANRRLFVAMRRSGMAVSDPERDGVHVDFSGYAYSVRVRDD